MRFYFKTRHTMTVLASVIGIGIGILLIDRSLVLHHASGVVTFPLSAPLQILIAGTLALGLSSRVEQFEFASVRLLSLLRLANAAVLTLSGVGVSVVISLAVDDAAALTVGPLAPLRAFIGLFGLTLAAVAFTDMRLGVLCALPFVFLPAAFDLRDLPLGTVIGFVLGDAEISSWVAVCIFAAAGLILYATCYSERNSPSPNRRSLIDSRSLRRRVSVE